MSTLPRSLLRALPAILLAALLALLAPRVLARFGPDSADHGFHSDAAISVLMARDGPVGLFSAYYYGQDRFGAWPHLLAFGVSRIAGFEWSARGFAAFHLLLALGGAAAFLLLGRRLGALAATAYLAALLLHPARRDALDLQPYIYQLPLLAAALALVDRIHRPGQPSAKAPLLLAGVAFLATWTSSTTAPLLLAAVAFLQLEVVRQGRWRAEGKRLLARSALPLLAAGMAELLLRSAFQVSNKARYGQSFRTPLGLDLAFLPQNVVALGERLVAGHWVWVGAAALTALGAWLIGPKALGERTGGRALRLSAALCVLALGNFFLCCAVDHVRRNDYSPRYLVPTFLLGSTAGLLAIYGWLARAAERRRWEVPPVLPQAALAGVLTVALPAPGLWPPYFELEAVAQGLAQRPEKVLLGGYWQTYVLAALAPAKAFHALPGEGMHLRTPFALEALRTADQILVRHDGAPAFGTAERPVPFAYQYGELFRYRERGPAWAEHHFSVYARVPGPAREVALPGIELCREGGHWTAPAALSGRVLVLGGKGIDRAHGRLQVTLAGSALPVEAGPGALWVRSEAGLGALTLTWTGRTGEKPCPVAAAYLLEGTAPAAQR